MVNQPVTPCLLNSLKIPSSLEWKVLDSSKDIRKDNLVKNIIIKHDTGGTVLLFLGFTCTVTVTDKN